VLPNRRDSPTEFIEMKINYRIHEVNMLSLGKYELVILSNYKQYLQYGLYYTANYKNMLSRYILFTENEDGLRIRASDL
jgi:hypothetical protein